MGTFHKDNCTFVITSRSFLFRMRIAYDKLGRETQNVLFIIDNFFFSENTLCEMKWKKYLEPGRPQMTIWRMRIAC